MKWVSYGPRALLFRLAEQAGEQAFKHIQAIVAEIEKRPPAGLREYVPALTTILLEFDPRRVPDPVRIAPQLADLFESAIGIELPPSPVKEIPVTYDGEDL